MVPHPWSVGVRSGPKMVDKSPVHVRDLAVITIDVPEAVKTEAFARDMDTRKK